jgi:hypothetical protein
MASASLAFGIDDGLSDRDIDFENRCFGFFGVLNLGQRTSSRDGFVTASKDLFDEDFAEAC